MKKFWLVTLFLSLFFVVSCGSGETDTEELSDIPDWDYSNAVTDEDSTDSSAPIDNGNTDAADAADSSADTGDNNPSGDTGVSDEFPDDEEPVPQGCGNETVEYGERCDSAAPITCSNLNSNMTGATKCLADCTAFDMSTCDKKIWGALNVRFSTKFIMDNAKIGDSGYFAQGTLPYSAFNGLYGDKTKFFPQSGDGSVSFAVTDNYTGTLGARKRQLFVKQNPVSGYPRHELEFAPGTIKSGDEYRINAVSIFDLVDNLLKLVRYRLIDRQNGTECIMGIGYSGSVFITSVYPENADLYEGGSVEIVANNVDFYYPTEVPGLDEETTIPEEVLKYPLCSK
ncbi:hypothetical protein J5681_06310 [bacterium]|nr:hypothetical protein [bacterium]